jgi:cytochrome c553
VRATTLAAGGLACAGAAMTIAAFAGGGSSAQDTPATPAPTTHAQATKDGLHVWIANGCGGCHTFKAASSNGPIGPDIGRSLDGRNRDYVMRAIVLPNADVTPNYGSGIMPDDYAKRIAPDDLNRLVDFIVAGVASGR